MMNQTGRCQSNPQLTKVAVTSPVMRSALSVRGSRMAPRRDFWLKVRAIQPSSPSRKEARV